jgi:hypothetical protein
VDALVGVLLTAGAAVGVDAGTAVGEGNGVVFVVVVCLAVAVAAGAPETCVGATTAGPATSVPVGCVIITRMTNSVVTSEITIFTRITIIHCLTVREDAIDFDYITTR